MTQTEYMGEGTEGQIKNQIKHEEITLTWNKINVTLPNYKIKNENKVNSLKDKHIIKNISGIARPGEVLAILGSSGSGKTTLLNVLNFRNPSFLNVCGEIKINGEEIKKYEKIAPISGYVQQDDLFFGTLTVIEHLTFQAMLRMDKNVSNEEKIQRIEKLLKDFNLEKCKNTTIGNPELDIKGISGGERRRLTFASEVINDPGILFCDEPTSGLDSYMAMSIVESMKNLANNGKTIICTIHQPSSELFEMFDKVCLISEGRLAYIGDRLKAISFFESQGYKCPDDYNPADYFIKILSVTEHNKEESLDTINKIANSFKESDICMKLNSEIDFIQSRTDLNKVVTSPLPKRKTIYKSGIQNQLRWLLWRNGLSLIRDVSTNLILLLQCLFMGLMYGIIFYKTDLTQEGIQNINSLFFLILIYVGAIHMYSVANKFPERILIFLREHQNGMYSVFSYYLSVCIVELPLDMFLPFLFISILYWMIGLYPVISNYLTCCLINMLLAQASVGFGHFLSAVSPSSSVATSIAGPFMGLLLLFSGFFLNNSSVPKFFLWLKYLSFYSYANDSFILNQWKDVTSIKCDNFSRCLPTGADVLDYLNINQEELSHKLIMLFAMSLGWRTLTFTILLIKSYER